MNIFSKLFNNILSRFLDWSQGPSRYQTNEPTVSANRQVLSNIPIINVLGKYKNGSSGKIDAEFICEYINKYFKDYSPKAAIIDMSKLEYKWGDEMERILDIDKDYKTGQCVKFVKIAFVVGPKCATAIGTLVNGIDSNKSATTEENIFNSLTEALNWVNK